MDRVVKSFKQKGEDGIVRRYTLSSHVSVDDLIRIGLKAYVYEVKTGEPYASPASRPVRLAITRTTISQ